MTQEFGVDPGHVLAILQEELQAAPTRLPALLSDPAPTFAGFTADSLTFSLNCRARSVVEQSVVRGELQRRVYGRFLQERIHFPVPSRTLHVPELEEILSRKLGEGGSADPRE